MSASIMSATPSSRSRKPRRGPFFTIGEGYAPGSESLWYKDAVFYELHVRAFQDSDGDGIGDFPGLIQRLDYLQDLGVSVIWLLPFYPSPLRDDGYDIAEYKSIHRDYGTLADFKRLLKEAHKRELRVVTELVLNHTSDQHSWFQRARRAAPGTVEREFYVWSDTPDRYKDTRIIFQDFESSNWAWDPVAKAYYWHRFYSHQPDLNFDNPAVRQAMFEVVDFWLDMGVDGMRLDAVPYLFQREGTNCENLPETHQFLKELRAHVDESYDNRMFLAEANMWPEDAVTYFGDGDECHMGFHFPLMPRLFMAMRMEDRYPIVDVLQEMPPIPDTCQWALFLRNHDELTLEMVTDEDRDYMYRVYASDPQSRLNLGIRRRLAPLMSNHRRKIELMNGLLLSLPGTPVIYYGDEIGMGDNHYLGDRNGVRTPMQWSPDRNAGFSKTNPQRLYLPVVIDPEYHYEYLNVEAQQNNPHSFLWWIKRLLALRRGFASFGRGKMELLHPDNGKVLAFLREYDGQRILVVANLSRFAQFVELDLREHKGRVPIELFGRTRFPPIGDNPYFLTLSSHAFHWFLLAPSPESTGAMEAGPPLPVIRVRGSWKNALRGRVRPTLLSAFERYFQRARWFGGKARPVSRLHIADLIAPETSGVDWCLVLVQVEYREGEPASFLLPLAFSEEDRASAESQVAQLTVERKGEEPRRGFLYEPVKEPFLAAQLLNLIGRQRRISGDKGVVLGERSAGLKNIWSAGKPPPESTVMDMEQSNTSIRFGQELILKLFRKVDQGINPDLEIGRFLTEQTDFEHFPRVLGSLSYHAEKGVVSTLGVLQEYIPNENDAWRFTLDSLQHYWERCLSLSPEERGAPDLPPASLEHRTQLEPDEKMRTLIGPTLNAIHDLGGTTGEMHLALASGAGQPDFAPEPDPPHFARSLHQSVRSQARESMDLLKKNVHRVPEADRSQAELLLSRGEILSRWLRDLTGREISAQRIRCHGDYHLGQILHTGRDFVVIDFEGEPLRSISERRLKRSPLRDVAGLLRSLHYATVFGLRHGEAVRPEDRQVLGPWAKVWYGWMSGTFLKGYLETVGGATFLPGTWSGREALLTIFLFEKAAYELRYELNNRPDWVRVPVEGLLELLSSPETEET
jgi:maltose alpha-D-glucosyltransferase / alpha-amylase